MTVGDRPSDDRPTEVPFDAAVAELAQRIEALAGADEVGAP